MDDASKSQLDRIEALLLMCWAVLSLKWMVTHSHCPAIATARPL
jgi:hypothetical protein